MFAATNCQVTKKRKFLTILLLGLLTSIVPFSIDMYLPGFPDIARSMGTTVSKVALSLSSFFIGLAIGQLAYGPILDRFGRKKPVYLALIFYCITSIGCSFSGSIEVLIGLRFFQAIGACAASVAAIAMVRDLFPAHQNARIFSFLILVLSASPMLAPTIGGYITAEFGWQSIFIVLTVLIVVILIGVFLFLPDGKPADEEHSLRIPAIIKGYKAVLSERTFLLYAFVGAVGFGGLFVYIASSPAIFMGGYKLSQKEYGFLFAFIASGLIIASQINNLLLRRFTSEQIVLGILLIQNVIGVLLLIATIAGLTNFWALIILIFCFIAPSGCMMPNASALSMRPFDHNAGSAAAMLGFIQMGIGSLATILIGFLDITSVRGLSAALVVGSALALILLLLGRKSVKMVPAPNSVAG
ncbi:MAG: Multidrug transporter [Sphingobacteriaceae bacterium]|jgi:DHA1 family bicyclomycin/chloramphenicol resistance-like MFS transporter|nr:Multidrug transporter [Sphingobacteriaceae bacterium]